jgi:hypothetical protein
MSCCKCNKKFSMPGNPISKRILGVEETAKRRRKAGPLQETCESGNSISQITSAQLQKIIMIIQAKLNLKKVDKKQLFHSTKTDAVFLDIVIMENRGGRDKYGNDFMVIQSVSKEERLAGRRGPILGNGKFLDAGFGQKPQQEKPETEPTPEQQNDELPF